MKSLKNISVFSLIAIFVAASILCCCSQKAANASTVTGHCHKAAKSHNPSTGDQPCCTKIIKSVEAIESTFKSAPLVSQNFYPATVLIAQLSFLNKVSSSAYLANASPPAPDTPSYIKNHNLRL